MFKTVLWLVVALLAVLRCPVGAQTKVFRIGYLGIGAGPNKSFLQGMETLGYIKDKNVVIEYRALPSSFKEIKEIVTELVRLEVDVIYAGPPSAVAAAKQVTDRIPIVMNAVTDPIEQEFIQSLVRPGRNITGVINSAPQLSGKILEILTEAVPGVNRVGVLLSSGVSTNSPALKIMESSARLLKLQLQIQEVQSGSDFGEVFLSLNKAQVRAAVLLPALRFSRNERTIAKLALAHRLPMIYWRTSFADAGGFMAYGPSLNEGARRAGVMVGKILNGINPADLPVEQPTRIDFAINLKTAKALDIRVPSDLLVEATRVIE